jgi:hypothetical protein
MKGRGSAKQRRKVCNHDCLNCRFRDCISRDSATKEESEAIANAIGGYATENHTGSKERWKKDD